MKKPTRPKVKPKKFTTLKPFATRAEYKAAIKKVMAKRIVPKPTLAQKQAIAKRAHAIARKHREAAQKTRLANTAKRRAKAPAKRATPVRRAPPTARVSVDNNLAHEHTNTPLAATVPVKVDLHPESEPITADTPGVSTITLHPSPGTIITHDYQTEGDKNDDHHGSHDTDEPLTEAEERAFEQEVAEAKENRLLDEQGSFDPAAAYKTGI